MNGVTNTFSTEQYGSGRTLNPGLSMCLLKQCSPPKMELFKGLLVIAKIMKHYMDI